MLLLPFAQTIQDIKSFRSLSKEFLTVQSHPIFEDFEKVLERISTMPADREFRWEIAEASPLKTIGSAGEYEPNGKGIPIYGQISSVWEISPVGNPKLPKRNFRLVGKASTKVHVYRSNGEELACWRMEVADPSSPGVYFHSQLDGMQIPVPRLPLFFATPMASLEFLFGEIFQVRWRKAAASNGAESLRWRKSQKTAFTKTLDWNLEVIEKADVSPWSALKAAQPPENLFVTQ